MNYIKLLLYWGAVNLYMLIVACASHYPLTYFMIYFFAGVFLILGYGMVERIKKSEQRMKINLSSLKSEKKDI